MSNKVVMVVRRLIFIHVGLVLLGSIGVARVGEWKSFTDMKNVRSVSADSVSVWAATSGGVFRFSPTDSTFQKFTNSEGLTSNDATAIYIADNGMVWVGEQSGAINVYNPSTGVWHYINDVLVTDKPVKVINNFYEDGDKMYIATSFGLSVFSISKFEFIDTYANFAQSLQPNVIVAYSFGTQVFVGTSDGIMVSKAGATNLAAPESWTAFPGSQIANSFAVFNGSLYAGSNAGVLQYESGTWVPVANTGTYSALFGVSGSSLIIAANAVDNKHLLSMDNANVITTHGAFPDSLLSGCVSTTGTIYAGFFSLGMGVYNASNNNWNLQVPNGPNSNSFYDLAIDENGVLWSASGRSNGHGFYSYDGSVWKNYTTATNPLIRSNDCFAVSIGPNNSKWISTWGSGLLLLNSEGAIVHGYDYDNPGFIGLPGDPASQRYIVPAKVARDHDGNIWTSIYRSSDLNKVVWEMTPDSVWHSYPGSPFGSYSYFMLGVETDQYNTKWFVNTLPGFSLAASIVYFNEQFTIGDGTVNGWGTLTEDDGATNTAVQSVAIDRSGDVWLGTGTGITIITDPSQPQKRISQVYLGSIRDLSINCIAVDPLDNKWLGTALGVFVLSPGGDQLLNQYNVVNTDGKLVDNNVLSIAFDEQKGIAYFGTEKGLSSLEITPIASKGSMSVIDLSPNPVYLPQQSSVEIRGLVDESTIKVLSISGKVVREFAAQGGGRAFWNCRDSEGKMVATGIYIVVAHDRTGTQVASAKVAVIHQ